MSSLLATASADTVAVIVMAPLSVTDCGNALADWRVWDLASTHRSLVVIFTHAPTGGEVPLVAAARLGSGYTLRQGEGTEGRPSLSLFANGDHVATAVGQAQMLDLLRRQGLP